MLTYDVDSSIAKLLGYFKHPCTFLVCNEKGELGSML